MVFLGIDWGKILSLSFWLDVNPGELSPLFEKYFLIILFVCYSFYGISKLAQKRAISKQGFLVAKFWQKVANFCLTMAISFTFIFFFRYEAIAVLGGRFWILLWLITGAIWLSYLVRYYFIDLTRQLKQLEEKKRFNKYLVKGK